MSKETLNELLKRKHLAKARDEVHWHEIRDEWLQALSNLFREIREWLQEAVDQGYITIEEQEFHNRWEENIGQYSAPQMSIRVGANTITINPIARFVVGGMGRVDITCGGRKVGLVRNKNQQWDALTAESPGFRYATPFTIDSFQAVIEGLIAPP